MLDLSGALGTLAVARRRVGCVALVLALAVACTPEPAQAQAEPTSTSGSEEAADPEAPGTAWDYFRTWYRLQWRWHRLWLERRRAEASHERCGDAQLQSSEQCDDGNTAPGDGCSASCELEDKAETPGDDRPGFVLCASSADARLTCSPEQRCCRSPENVCDTLERDCQREDVTVGWGDDCDGPEDCEADLTCVSSKYGSSCTGANPQQGYPVLCHVDSDCAFILEARCGADGVCTKL
jgi:cysteine-rich repeat protein